MGPARRRNSRIVNDKENAPVAPTPKVPDTLTHPSERVQATKRYYPRGLFKKTKVSSLSQSIM